MSKRVKQIAGCDLPNGERLALRRVEYRFGPTLLSSHIELSRGDAVLATGPADIISMLHVLGLSAANERWMLGHLREAVKS